MKPVTDFGEQSVVIARGVSWSRDGQHVYAAVATTLTDIVLLDGLLSNWPESLTAAGRHILPRWYRCPAGSSRPGSSVALVVRNVSIP